MAELIRENCTRKIDSLGRVSIPKGIRDRLEIGTNEELEFLTMGNYVCMRKVNSENKYKKIAKMMEELGLEIPDAVKQGYMGADDGGKEYA